MLNLLSLFCVFAVTSARPQDLETNKVLPVSTAGEAAPVVVNNDASYGLAVDISLPTTPAMMTCVKNARYDTVFVRGFTPAGFGAFDSNSVATIRNAYNAGLGIEVYMTPQPISRLRGDQQFDVLYNGLTDNGITVRSVWIQVTSPNDWSSSISNNKNVIMTIISRAKQYGLTVGIYTNQYDWSQITANWSDVSSDVLLWYWNVLGSGVSGETNPNFDDFRSFGSFKKASVKQYAQSESVCQLVVNRDVYAVGIPAAASAKEASAASKNGKILVGGIVGF